MKVIIAGSRTIVDYKLVEETIARSGFNITEVVCGGARGVDTLGETWAKRNNISVKMFPADWNRLGKSAGYHRNVQMAEYADALIAVTTGSAGTAHMIRVAKEKKLHVYISYVK